MEKSKIVLQIMAGFSAVLAMACSGFHLGWSSPSLPKLLADDSDLPITSGEGSWIVSFYEFGCGIGPLISFVLVDRCGRKFTLLLTVIPYLVSCILLGVAQSYWWIVVARFIAGLGTGISYTVTPMYVGEIADDRIRGAMGSIIGLVSAAGLLLAYSVGPWVDRVVFAGVGAALPILFAMTFVWMPESPYFLVMGGRLVEAEKSLKWLRGSEQVGEELKKIEQSVEFDQQNAGTMMDLVMVPGNRKALIIIIGLILAQQFGGINAVLAYSGIIFEASGSMLDSSILVIIIGVIIAVSAVLTTFIVDLVGRRPLLLVSCCGAILFLSGEALYFQLQDAGIDVSGISWLAAVGIIGYSTVFTIGLGLLPHILVSELFPCNVKALATMATFVVGSFSGMAVTKLYQVVADAYGIQTSFWGFAGITVISTIFMYFVLPETKQRSFKSIQAELHKTAEPTVKLEKSEAA